MVWEAAYIHSPQAANRVKVTLRFQGSNRPLQTLQVKCLLEYFSHNIKF